MKTINELSKEAVISCLNIFSNYSVLEADRLTQVIKNAWHIGNLLQERQDYLDAQECRLDPGVHKE